MKQLKSMGKRGPVSLRWLAMYKSKEQGLDVRSMRFNGNETTEGFDFWMVVNEQAKQDVYSYYQQCYPFKHKPNLCYPERYYTIIQPEIDLDTKELPVVIQKGNSILGNEFKILYESTTNLKDSYIRKGCVIGTTTLREATSLEITLFKLIEKNGTRR